MTLPALTDTSFDSSLSGDDTPVLVDFWAPWCGPCRQLAPTLEAVADQEAGRIRIVTVNVDENPKIAARFGIRALPTLLLMKQGEVISSRFGVQSISSLRGWIDTEC